MKNEQIIFIFLLLSIAASIFHESQELLTVEAPSTKVVEIENFDSITLEVPCNVYFVKSKDQSIMLEGPDTVLDQLTVSVSNNTLQIRSTDLYISENWRQLLFSKAYGVNIYIPSDEPDLLEVTGLGAILGQVTKQENELSIRSLGLGEIFIYAKKSDFQIDQNGPLLSSMSIL